MDTKRHVNLGAHQVTHSFLVIPECPAPLLGRDLLSKVNAQIHFDHGQMSVLDGTGHPLQVLSLALKDEYRLYLPEAPGTISPKYNHGLKDTLRPGLKQQESDWPNRGPLLLWN